MLRSLEGEAAMRYTSARELAQALTDGVSGREPSDPGEATTRAIGIGARTDTTRRMDTSPDPATPVSPLPPAPRRPAPRPAARQAPASRRKRSAFAGFARGVGILVLIAILAAVIAAAVLLITDAGQGTDLGQLIKDNLSDQVQAVEDFIREHTQ